MYCINCGKMVVDGARFCANCGAAIQPETSPSEPLVQADSPAVVAVAPVEPSVAVEPQADNNNQVKVKGSPLAYGILSLCFGLTPFVNFLGMVFSSKAKKLCRNPLRATHQTDKIALGLAKAGKVTGIIFTIVWSLYIVLSIALIVLAAVNHESIQFYMDSMPAMRF